jgi:hypothetical protein
MSLIEFFQTYIHYLIHPFKSHDALMGYTTDLSFTPKKISVYEALGASWVFIVVNGIVRIFLINFVLLAFLKLMQNEMGILTQVVDSDGLLGFYFLILSTILDVIFYPLFMLFLIQFWEFVIKIFARLLGHQENIEDKARSIMTVALSSHVFSIVPVFGNMAQKISAVILMYAGLRKQLNASPMLACCILAVPIFLFLCFFSLIMLIVILKFL